MATITQRIATIHKERHPLTLLIATFDIVMRVSSDIAFAELRSSYIDTGVVGSIVET